MVADSRFNVMFEDEPISDNSGSDSSEDESLNDSVSNNSVANDSENEALEDAFDNEGNYEFTDEEMDSHDIGSENDNEEYDKENDDSVGKKPKKSGALSGGKPLNEANLKKFQEKIRKSGVIYFSRIPPFMKPMKLKSILSKYTEVGKIFLNPEDTKITMKRKKYKHNKRINYTEGWVEFPDKRAAKQLAAALNNQPIGGKKRSYYHDDIWNMKYLPGFKWHHLSEQMAYERKVKEQKLRLEISKAKKETETYMKNVNQSKMINAIEERKKAKENASSTISAEKPKKPNRSFRQRKVAPDHVDPSVLGKGNISGCLSKIFG